MNLEELRLWILPRLKDTAFSQKSWFAGGCVRDYLLQTQRGGEFQFSINKKGLDTCLRRNNFKVESEVNADVPETIPIVTKQLSDVDICVNLPQGGILLARHLYKSLKGKANGLKVFPDFGTAGFKYKSFKLEFVATRTESYQPGNRYPKVEFGSLEDDVQRRDFTINALLMDIANGQILDLSGLGMPDLKSGVIRSLGKPETKFSEDPLRMLRAVRFSLRFGFTIEPETHKALISEAAELNNLSARLVQTEIDKMRSLGSQAELDLLFSKLGWGIL